MDQYNITEVSNLNQSYTWVGLNFIEKPLWVALHKIHECLYPQRSSAIRLQYKTLLLFPIVATALVLTLYYNNTWKAGH